jgi:hypothetical protein
MGTAAGAAAMYCLSSLLLTAADLFGGESAGGVCVSVINIAAIFGAGDWVVQTDFGYLGSLGALYGALPTGAGLSATLFLSVGFMLSAMGFASSPSRDVKGGDTDPREYLFTHRPMALARCLAMPWNSIPLFWGFKKAPVAIPIAMLPFIAPFALIADLALLIAFLILWAIMSLKIGSASKRDRARYDSLTHYAVCPKCKRNFYQPRVKCSCGLVFGYPVPGPHGAKIHTCNNGHSVPATNDLGGRGALSMVCPHCGSGVVTHEAKPLVVSLVGARDSGKTTLMLSSAESLCEAAKSKGVMAEFASPGLSPRAWGAKGRVAPTAPGELDSEFLFLRSRDFPEKEIMFNDISGSEFEPDRDKVLFEEYYKYNDGIIFAIDPASVVAVHSSQSPAKGSKPTPVSVMESFYHMYTEINGYGPSVRSTVPFAVVLTKMDDPRSSAAAAEGAEAFLARHGQGDFVKIARSAFENVRFFKVSSLGDGRNAAEPLAWILSENDEDVKRIF